MSEALQQFHFLRPWWLLLLAAMPVALWLSARGQAAQAQLKRLVDAELLPHLLRGRARPQRVPSILLAAGWTLCALAMAGPSWSRAAQPLYADRAAQVVAISLSQRMLARDTSPSRLDRARYQAHALFAANYAGLNGLVAYAGQAFVVAPLTSDAHSLDDLLDALAPDTMPVDGNDAAAAIERGAALIEHAGSGGGSLVLITDSADARAQTAARQARMHGVRVSVLGIGSPQGAPVPLADGGFLRDAQGNLVMARRDDTALSALAAAGGGRYVPGGEPGEIGALRGELHAGASVAAKNMASEQWQDRGPWLLLPLLPLLALAFRRGWLLSLPLLLLPALLPGRAEATGWHDLWQRPDQQAWNALRQGHAAQAQKLARDPALRGAAAYRAGDFKAAVGDLHALPSADAQYNLGNALAKAGHYRQALAAYDRALAKNPSDADAKANRQAVEDWLRRRQQQEKPGQATRNPGGKKNASNASPDHKQDGKDGQGHPRDAQQGSRPDRSQGPPGRGNSPQHRPATQAPPPARDEASNGGIPRAPAPAGQQAREQARKALQQQMDRALGKHAGAPREPVHQLGTLDPNDPQSRLPAELRQALQRVPDDPGALLRRKFELEYRQRQGDLPQEDGP